MPEKDGRYYVSFDIPEFYTETVDFSFDYMHCEKDYERILGVKVPYPKCGKKTKVIKFDVPRIKWTRKEIETPYVDEDEFDNMLKDAIGKLIDNKDGFKKRKEDVTKEFDEKILIAKEAGLNEEAELMALEKQLALKRMDMQIKILEEQIEKLGNDAGKALKYEMNPENNPKT